MLGTLLALDKTMQSISKSFFRLISYILISSCGLVLCCISVMADATSATSLSVPPTEGVIDIQRLWPFPNRIFLFRHANGTGESMWHERWGDHFTIHHWWNSQWCPRVDDVMQWQGNQLVYTDTYDFFQNIHTQHLPGQRWANRYMTPNGSTTESYFTTRVFSMSQTGCQMPSSETLLWENLVNRGTTALFKATIVWSAYTGYVAAIRMEQTTYFNSNPADYWKEVWYFYRHPSLGYIPVVTKGFRKEPGKPLNKLWDAFLEGVQ